MFGNIINVTALNTVINSIFRAEEHLHNIQVAGEISGFSIKNGHGYFELKDENCKIACNCFNCAKTYIPKNGEAVIVRGSVDYYAKAGKLNFNVDSITLAGQGLLALQLEMLRQQLEKEGLFDQRFKKDIPKYPSNVCVITSRSGAVIKDIKKTIRRKNDLIDIFIKDVRVQGTEAVKDIVKALEAVDGKGFDVLIIARGGGSAEELMPFNDESLVRAVFRCRTPVISAVGHESDVTLCDRVADHRAATPTAAAECIAYDTQELKSYLEYVLQKMRSSVSKKVDDGEKELVAKLKYINSLIKSVYSDNNYEISRVFERLKTAARNSYIAAERKLDYAISALKANNPLDIMAKGYWHVSKDGASVVSTKELFIGDSLTMRSKDGKVIARVLEVENEI